jgi:DNA modification methylase
MFDLPINLNLSELSWGEEISLPTTRKLRYTPHFIGGKYPCRSVAYIPHLIFKEYSKANLNKSFTVLDPFMGSGTTAIEANRYTSKIYGIEIDPYAKLIATVSNLKYTEDELAHIKFILHEIIQNWDSFNPKSVHQPILRNIQYWFNQRQFDDLLKLKTAIFELTKNNKKINSFMLVVFAEIIRSCSKAERQSLKPYISKKYPKVPNEVLPSFEKAINKYLISIKRTSEYKANSIIWLEGDATNFRVKNPIDIIVTSPPYINALDYTRCIKLESSWAGLMDDSILNEIKSGQVGEAKRVKFVKVDKIICDFINEPLEKIRENDHHRFNTISAYFQDIFSNLRCAYDSLADNGEYHLIIGNSLIRGIYIETHEIIAQLAQKLGFKWDNYFKYPIKDHRTSIPRNGNGGKIAFEHVIKLVKK